MMNYYSTKLIHLIAIFMLFLSFGLLLGSKSEKPRLALVLHGMALIILIISGFGILAYQGIHGALPHWIIGKLVIWLLLGVSATFARRKLLPQAILIPLLLLLGGASAYLSLWKK